jgi:AcrR family transcriptional regulator
VTEPRRELRAQGRRTRQRLLDAGARVFAERGYHSARVDDIVRAARTSHGTFYLYFSNKDDLLHALAVDCRAELIRLAAELGPIAPDADGFAEVWRFLQEFADVSRRHGPVIRVWSEGTTDDAELREIGASCYAAIVERLVNRITAAGAAAGRPARDPEASGVALFALVERFAYILVSRGLITAAAEADGLGAVARVVHRGFFAGAGEGRR